LYYLALAGFGLIFGSFFNVVIFRVPRGESLGERSRCPSCGEMIRWYDNVPLLSFVILRGRCRRCGLKISWQYPLVELTTCLLFVLAYWWSIEIVPGILNIPGGKAFQPELLLGLVLVSIAVIISATDIIFGIIPTRVIFIGNDLMLALVLGLAFYRQEPYRIVSALALAVGGAAFIFIAGMIAGAIFLKDRGPIEASEYSMGIEYEEHAPVNIGRSRSIVLFCLSVAALIAALALALSYYHQDSYRVAVSLAVAIAGGAFFMAAGFLLNALSMEEEDDDEEEDPKPGIGFGDVRLFFFTGLALGYFHWYFILIELLLSSVLALLAALILRRGRKAPLAFGPFLAAGAILTLVLGQAIFDLYLKLLR
jgi:prepilin signal peptidase PulO-like enzyme (type II secretory pathway)